MTLEQAKNYTIQKHLGQTRKQGTPYYLHPFAVSEIIRDNGYNTDYQIAGLFHDLLEDTDVLYDDLLQITTKEIANAVKLVTKEKNYNMNKYIDRIKQNKMALVVKLADRLHNLSEAHLASVDFINKYIIETEIYYLDLAKSTCFEKIITSKLNYLRDFII